jgi:predicted heme/steroid binding protein
MHKMHILLIILLNSLFFNECQQQSTIIPVWVDWRTQGYVTPVKRRLLGVHDNGRSRVGAYYRATGKLVDLSPQQLVDCMLNGKGCSAGSDAPSGFDYIIKKGFASLTDYPYTGKVRKKSVFFLFTSLNSNLK